MKDGAHIRIIDLRSSRQFDVEAIQPRRNHRPAFGDSLREQCNGAITEKESQITEASHSQVGYAGNPSDFERRKLTPPQIEPEYVEFEFVLD